MKGNYSAFGGRLNIEVEGSSIKDIIKAIGPVAEILDADSQCGACGKDHIYPSHRVAQGFDFYELKCGDCGARLSFGQFKDGSGLFAKRNNEAGNPLPDRGWHVYQRDSSEPREAGPRQPEPRSGPQPKQEVNHTAELKALIAKLHAQSDTDGREDVLSQLFQQIGATKGDGEAQKRWRLALKIHGDPVQTGRFEQVLVTMYYGK